MRLGAHVSTAGGVSNALNNAAELGIKTFQIFTRNQNRWQSKPIPPEEAEKFISLCEENGIQDTIAHDSYLINLCSPDKIKLDKSITAFEDEIRRADQLKLDYLVTHPGSHLGNGEETGCKLVAESLNRIFDRNPDGRMKVLLETTAGQGTNLGHRFEHLADIIERVEDRERMGVCLDTCHVFAAGYDFSSEEKYSRMMSEFDNVVGLSRLRAIHLNDSKRELGSRVDRHANIGAGEIGKSPFSYFLADDRLKAVPGILETPGELEDYERDLQTLRKIELHHRRQT